MKTKHKTRNISEETHTITIWSMIIALFLLYHVTDAKFLHTGSCQYGNGNLNCSNLLGEIAKQTDGHKCPINLWKIRLNVTKKNEKDPVSCTEKKVGFSVECAAGRDILDKSVKAEICALNASGTIEPVYDFYRIRLHFNDSITKRQCLNVKNDSSSCYKIRQGHRAKYGGLSLFSPGRKWVKARLREKRRFYNQFLLDNNSEIMLISLSDTNGTSVNESVQFFIREREGESILKTLPTDVRVLKLEKKCMWMDPETYTWTDDKCVTLSTDDTSTECKCEHNSAFAAVFAMRNVTIPPQISTASTVFEVISIVLLLLTAILLGVYRRRLGNFDRVLVQISLCVALLLEHLFFVVSPAGVEIKDLCIAFAALIHYFLVVTSVLMVLDGALMLAKVLAPQAFTEGKSTKRRRFLGFAIAWVLPLLYAIICAIIGITNKYYLKGYKRRGRYEYCFISPEYNYVVIIPVGIALCINIGVAIRLAVLVWHMSKKAEEYKPSHQRDRSGAIHARKALRAVAVLLPILGIPWTIGFLVNIEYMEIVFMSIHVLVNGLQGLFVFLHYAAFNGKIRTAVKRTWKASLANASSTPTVHFVSNNTTSKKHDSASTS